MMNTPTKPIALALGLVLLASACAGDPSDLPDDVDSASAALDTEVVWTVYGEAAGVRDIAACPDRLYKLTTSGQVLSAPALQNDGYPIWRTRRSVASNVAQITCGRNEPGTQATWYSLFYMTTVGAISYEAVSQATSPIWPRTGNATGARDFKAFHNGDLWTLLASLWGQEGMLANLGPEIDWQTRGHLWAAKRTAATVDATGRRLVIAINNDNSFWLSRDAGRTFETLRTNVDSQLVGAYASDLEATFGADGKVYLYALFKAPYSPFIYRGSFRP